MCAGACTTLIRVIKKIFLDPSLLSRIFTKIYIINIMSKKVAAKKSATKIELQKSFLRVRFHVIIRDCIQKLIFSMPERCKTVIAARGGSTKY